MITILGISAFYHDSAAAIIVDGVVVAAAQEERFSRKKHDASFPTQAIEYCLTEAGISAKDLNHVAFYEKPFLKFERILETSLAFAPFGLHSFRQAMPQWLRSKLYISRTIRKRLGGKFQKRIVFPEHHESHAASAFFLSPFQEAAILTADGAGEWATTTLGVGRANQIELQQEIAFPDSLGLLYSAFTYFCGFRVNGGEGKLMGLASYGNPIYVDTILENVVDLKNDGSFRLDQTFFDYCTGSTMTSRRFDELFGGPSRIPESEITQREKDLAASIQELTARILLKIANHLHATTGMKNLCIAGGVGLNCVANGRLLRESPFENVWIQPASGDAGGAIGAAMFVWHQLLERSRTPVSYQSSFLGPSVSKHTVDSLMVNYAKSLTEFDSFDSLAEHVAELLAQGKIVGWMQGRMEFGPRALGNRSILASPLDGKMKDQLNDQVKFRESFRPFAPIVLAESCSEYFELEHESSYMLLAAKVREQANLPAVTHVDKTARVQTVNKEQNDRLYQLLKKFEARTGCPVLINTSFNVRGEPIVCNERDAMECFFKTGIDVLVAGDYLLLKEDLPNRDPAQLFPRIENPASLWSRITGISHQISFPIRWLVSAVVLTIIYYIFITPVGVIWRKLNRRAESSAKTFLPIDRDCESYWRKRAESPDKSRYFKQY